MVKKILFIIAMSLVLTGCSMFSKDEPETMAQEDISSDILGEESVGDMATDESADEFTGEQPTDGFGNITETVDGLIGDAADSLGVMANDAAGLMNDIGDALDGGETDSGMQTFNNAQPQVVSQVQNNYVRPPQTYMDVRLNYVIDLRKQPVWKVADLTVNSEVNISTGSSGAQVEMVSSTLSPKVQEVWQKGRTDGTVSGKDLKDLLSANVVDKRTLLIHTKAMDAESNKLYYGFGSKLANGSYADEVPELMGEESTVNAGGITVEVVEYNDISKLTKPSGKDYYVSILYTSSGLIEVSEDLKALTAEGFICYVADDSKFSLQEIKDAEKEELTIGFIANEV